MFILIWVLPVNCAVNDFSWIIRVKDLIASPIEKSDDPEEDAVGYYLKAMIFALTNCGAPSAEYQAVLESFDKRIEELQKKGELNRILTSNKADFEFGVYPDTPQGRYWDALRFYGILREVAELDFSLEVFCPNIDHQLMLNRMLYLGDEQFFFYHLGAIRRKIARHGRNSTTAPAMRALIRFSAHHYSALFTEAMLYSPAFISNNLIQVVEGKLEIQLALAMLKELYETVRSEG